MALDLADAFAHAVVSTSYGRKSLRVKQFLFTLRLKHDDNLAGFDLNEQETAVSSQFKISDYYTDLLRNAPLEANAVFCKMVAEPSIFYLPRLPTSHTLGPMHLPFNLTNVKKLGSNVINVG